MGVLKGFLYACAIAFGLTAVGILFVPSLWILVKLGVFVVAGGLAYLVYRQAAVFTGSQSENQKTQLADTYKLLAEQHDGAVPMEAIMRATGASKAQVQSNMRALIGQGVCELDFGPKGEIIYKATPMDEARANLAAMSEKNRIG